MVPRGTPSNIADVGFRHVEFPSSRKKGSAHRTDGKNVGVLKLGFTRFLAVAIDPSVFGIHVRNVVGPGSKKQMCRVHTWSVVAPMKDAQAFWDRAIGKNPCNPVSASDLPVVVEQAVSRTDASIPFPAIR